MPDQPPAPAPAPTPAPSPPAAPSQLPEQELRVPRSILEKLRPVAEAAGVQLPDASIKWAPELNISVPISHLAVELGRWCSQRNLFLSPSGIIVTVCTDPHQTAGSLQLMKPERFGSWVEKFVTTYRPAGKGSRVDCTLKPTESHQILSSDQFRAHLRPLLGVNPVRMPAWDPDSGSLRLLPAGYDPATQTFTLDSLPYASDWTLEQANQFAETLLKDFPWAEDPADDILEQRADHTPDNVPLGLSDSGPATRRSAAVAWALTVGIYCRNFFPAGTTRPLGLYLANQAGSGKTRLAQIALSPVFGETYEADLPANDEEMAKALSTEAINLSPYVFFDDIGRGLYSTKLNRFITSSGHTGRLMGGQSKFAAPQVSQVFATGNWVRLSADLQRRSLVSELFLSGEVSGRKFAQTLTATLLRSTQWRSDALAALWAFVRHWHAHGAPRHRTEMPSFEAYSATIGGILTAAGWADAFTAPTLDTGGDVNTQHIQELLTRLGKIIIEEHWPRNPQDDDDAPPAPVWEHTHAFSRVEVTDHAREWELLDWMLGTKDDPPLKPVESRKFGSLLREWRGREILFSHERGTTLPDGTETTQPWRHSLTFGRRHTRKGSSYDITVKVIQ